MEPGRHNVSSLATGEPEPPDQETRRALLAALLEQAELGCWNAKRLRAKARYWRRVDGVLSMVAAGTAGVAGTTGLTSIAGANTVSWLALASAVAIAAKASLNAGKLADDREAAASICEDMYTDAKHWGALDLNRQSYDKSRARLDELAKQPTVAFKLTTAVEFAVKPDKGRWLFHRRGRGEQLGAGLVGRAPDRPE